MPEPASPSHAGPLAKMAGNSVAANLLMLILLVGGLVMALQIKQEVFPDFTIDQVTVRVAYPGATPEDVEKSVLLPIEEAIMGLEGVREVTSTAREGSGQVIAEVVEGEDLQNVFNNIKNEVDRIITFPEEAEEPQIFISGGGAHGREVLKLVLSGPVSYSILRDRAEWIREELVRDPGITQAELNERPRVEVKIEVPRDELRRLGLTLSDITGRIRSSSLDLPAGSLQTEGGDILVRISERKEYAAEFAKLPLLVSETGSELLLSDVARIVDGYEDTDLYTSYNGERAVLINVQRVGEETPITVSQAVKKHVERINRTLPQALSLTVLNDRSDIFKQRMDLLLKNAYLGLTLVFILLALFLESRLAFWVSLGIPVSFLGSFLLLSGVDISINMVSMFAFIVTLGIVVDDAIVVGENIYSYRQQGYSGLEASIRGAKDIALPVTFSVLTNIVAFMPMFFVPGIMGKIFRQIPIIVISVFIISLIESLLVLPAHLAHQKRAFEARGPLWFLHRLQQRFSRWFSHLIEHRYGPFIEAAVRQRYITMSFALAVLILSLGFVLSGRMGFTLFPTVESDFAFAEVTLPVGTPLDRTRAVAERLLDNARRIAEQHGGEKLVKGIHSQAGGSQGAHQASLRVFLTDPQVRPISTQAFTEKWREMTGRIAGVESMRFRSDLGGPGSGPGLTIELHHERIETLREASRRLTQALSGYPVVSEIDDGFSLGKPQLSFSITPEARASGLRAGDIASSIRNRFYGDEAIRQIRGSNEMRVMVRLPEEERDSLEDIQDLILRSPSGTEIPLREAAVVEHGRSFTTIERSQGQRVIAVTAEVTPREQAGRIISSLQSSVLPELKRSYPDLDIVFAGRQEEMRTSMQSLFSGLLLAMLCIYGLLAVPFRSYLQPLIIMASIPFGIIGAVIGHLLMGYSLSVISMFGMVALTGVVVNDSLVLIDFANRNQIQAGQDPVRAVKNASILRFRPVLLTTLTTFFGLSPMIFETSIQARFLIPMALSLGFGILFATGIILILVPCLYSILEDLRGGIG